MKYYQEQSSEEEHLLEKLDGQKLRKGIEAVRTAGKVKWHGGVKEDGVIQMPFPEYPDGVWESLFVMDMDKNYSENYENSCKGVLPSEMNVQQIRTVLTYSCLGKREVRASWNEQPELTAKFFSFAFTESAFMKQAPPDMF